ncbi:MAG: AMP-binding protein [Burkholderiaceae bacterium]
MTASNPTLIPMGDLPAWHAARGRGPAVTIDDRTLSWADLDARSTQRAREFARRGVRHGDFVTVALPNGFGFYETTFALWKLGAIPNVVSPKLPPPELAAIIELARPSLVVVDEVVVPDGVATYRISDQGHLSQPVDRLPSVVSPNWKAMTSGGSTGRPKIIVDHMPGEYDPSVGFLQQPVPVTALNPGPLYHNAPFITMHHALFCGGHVVDMVRFDALRALELIERHRVQWVNLVPTMMHRIWRLPAEQRERFDLSSLEVVWHMASACPPWLKQNWIDWLGPERIYELYGGTERQGATVLTGTEWLSHRGSVGKVQPGSRLQVLDANGQPCAPGEVGEIYFLPDTGRNSTYHYLGAEARTSGDWESLGDLGYLDADGYLYLVDRRTDLVISGGANIYPAEVEAVLDAHPRVLTSAVIGLPDDDLGHRVHAIVQISGSEDAGCNAEVLREFVGERLARYKVPRTFELVDYPLRDDAGKARRSALREARMR